MREKFDLLAIEAQDANTRLHHPTFEEPLYKLEKHESVHSIDEDVQLYLEYQIRFNFVLDQVPYTRVRGGQEIGVDKDGFATGQHSQDSIAPASYSRRTWD